MTTNKVIRLSDEERAKLGACLLTLKSYVKADDNWENKEEIYTDITELLYIIGLFSVS